MIVILHRNIDDRDKKVVRDFLEQKGFKVKEIVGEEETIFGAVGQLAIDIRSVELLSGVSRVIPISKPYKLASRELKKSDTVFNVGPVNVGGSRIIVIAGPCAIESEEQIMRSAEAVSKAGAVILRGGAYKPRTSPYSFQGLKEEGLKYLKQAGEKYGLPVVTEIVASEHADMMKDYIDLFQIGARNMQNFELLKKVGSIGKPVILKRGMSATIEEWLMAAEYLLANGTDDVILCERGIRTFETYTRNTLDLSAIPVVKKLSHLPVIVDPSHGTGLRGKVLPMSLAGIAAGADGLIVEVHPEPEKALSDGPQSLYPEEFEKLMRDIEAIAPVVGKEIARLPRKKREISASVSATKKEDGISVAFQGERGAYSEKAIMSYFPEHLVEPVPGGSFRSVFESVLSGKTMYGILPIENSLAGSIHENYDLFLQYPDVSIVGEIKIRIRHNLIALPGTKIEDIKEVYSHPQGLAQCEAFLDTNPSWTRVPFYDTAGSVAYLSKEKKKNCAAIASKKAADVFGMEILKEGIETNPSNYTRFFVIQKGTPDFNEGDNKVSLVCSLKDEPGALSACLSLIAKENLNMHKLESRPILGSPWRYMFYIDIVFGQNQTPEAVKQALNKIEAFTEDFRILGLYKA